MNRLATRLRWPIAAGLAVAVAVAIAVPAALSSSAKTGAGKPDFKYLRGQIDKYAALPKFIAPGPAFDTKKVKGKSIFSIPVSSANPFTANIETAMQGAAKLLGIKFTNFTNQAQVSQWVQGMGQATNQKVDMIDLLGGVDPRVLGPQIKRAQSAGIKIAASHLYDVNQKPVAVDYSIPADYTVAARLEADWIILDTKGKSHVVVVTSNEIVPTSAIVAALKSEFATQCPACKVTFINAPVADWATKITPNVAAELQKDSQVNYVLPIYDSMSQFVVPAITTAGKAGKVHIATYNGTPFVMGYLSQGNAVRFEVGENLNWLGWAYIDAEARVLAGLKVPKAPQQINEHTALRAFTSKNIKEAGNPPKLSTGYGDAYEIGYKNLWGLGAGGAGGSTKLTGIVGPGYTIVLKDSTGKNARTLAAGTYTITIKDLSAIHNFHLTGPGVNKMTDVNGTGTQVWTVKLTKGHYLYVCDPHASSMRGTLVVK